jgi:hypothetical protein
MKLPLGRSVFGANIHPKMMDKFPSDTYRIKSYIPNCGTKRFFVRKLRQKQVHKINSRCGFTDFIFLKRCREPHFNFKGVERSCTTCLNDHHFSTYFSASFCPQREIRTLDLRTRNHVAMLRACLALLFGWHGKIPKFNLDVGNSATSRRTSADTSCSYIGATLQWRILKCRLPKC